VTRILNSSGSLASPKSGISVQIGDAEGSSLQPGNSRVEVTVLRAQKLPRLKTLFGKKRRFYVTVTDGTIAKKTTAIRSVEQAVEWDEKLDVFASHPSSNIMLSLYAKRRFDKDILIGTYDIPVKPQRDVAVVLRKGEGSPSMPVTLHLTITPSAEPYSPAVTADNTSILITTEVDNQPAEGLGATAPVAQHRAVKLAAAASVSEPLSASTDYLPVESGAPALPTADCQPEKALYDADNAMKAMNLYDTWDNAVRRINCVMETVSPVAGVCILFCPP